MAYDRSSGSKLATTWDACHQHRMPLTAWPFEKNVIMFLYLPSLCLWLRLSYYLDSNLFSRLSSVGSLACPFRSAASTV